MPTAREIILNRSTLAAGATARAHVSTLQAQLSETEFKEWVTETLTSYNVATNGDVSALETKAQADARQAILVAEHDATQATLSTVGTPPTKEAIRDAIFDKIMP